MPYIGNQHNVGDHVNNFKVLDDISSHTATFDGSATSVVDTTNNTIRVPEHRFIQGQRVTYTNGGGGNIGGLTTGTAYFVSFDSANTIKLATTLANANSNTVINLSAVGSGTSHTLNVAFDGVNTKFKMTHGSGKAARLNNATQINVAINNVIQRPNINALSFTEGFALEDNHKIVFKTAPTVNDIFWGSIIANTIENFDLRDNEVDNFTGDGSTTEFTLSTIPANNESVIVSINGVVQHPSDKNTARSYTLIDSIIQFTAAPALGDGIQVRHIGFAGASTADVSGFYGRTGNVALTSSDHITTGDITSRNINVSGILTASSASFGGNVSIGGTLTYEDVTNIDSVGIITANSNIHLEDYIFHKGDLSAFFGFVSDDNILFGTSSSQRLKIHADGEVEIKAAAAGQTVLSCTGAYASSSTVDIQTWARSDGAVKAAMKYSHGTNSMNFGTTTNHPLIFQVNNLEKLRINSSGQVNIVGDLDVDGHTNLDNVSIAGVSTFSNSVKFVGTTSGRDLNWNYGSNKLNLADNVLLGLGNSDDLLIHHTGSTGYIKGQNGNLYIQSDQVVVIGNQSTSSAGLKFTNGGAAELFFNGAERFSTTGDGVKVTGTDSVLLFNATRGTGHLWQWSTSGTNATGIELRDTTANQRAYIYHDSTGAGGAYHKWYTAGGLRFEVLGTNVNIPNDTSRLRIGTSADLQLYHDNNGDSYISNATGHLTIRNNTSGKVINLQPKSGANGIIARYEGAAELYHNGNLKLETTNTGATITGKLTSDGLVLGDAETIAFGNTSNGDLKIYHDGSNGSIQNITGNLNLFGGTNAIYLKAKNDENSIVCSPNAQVELYYDGIRTALTQQDALVVHGRTSNSGMIEIASNQGANNNDRFRIHKTSAASRLSIQNYSTGSWVENIRITAGNMVELKHADGTTRMQTDSTGITVNSRITAAGDANTYINVGSSADTLDFFTGGSNFFRFDSSGRMLLNTVTEGHASADDLTIYNSGNGGITIRTGTTSNGAIFFSDATSGAAEYDGWVQYNHGNSPYMIFGTAGNTRLKIDNSGNITQTGGSYLIDSTGSAQFILDRANTSSGAVIDFKTAGTLKWYMGLRGLVNDTFYLRNEVNSEDAVTINIDGYIGINDANPYSGLTINKEGDYWDTNGNSYVMPEGKVLSSWRTSANNGEDYWVGFVGGYQKTSPTVNIALQPNTSDFNQQSGMYIAGEATSLSTSVFTLGRIKNGSQAGRGTSGAQRAQKEEFLRVDHLGKVGINESANINGRLHVQHDALAENILFATRYNDQSNDKPIIAITEAQLTGMTASGVIIGNHNRPIHIGAVFDANGAVSTGSITGMTLTANNRIGINETSPDTKLHISHANATEDVIKLEATPVTAATGERSRIIFHVTQSNGQAAKLGHIASHTLNGWGGELSFHTKPANSTPNNNVNERMRITASGSVKFILSDLPGDDHTSNIILGRHDSSNEGGQIAWARANDNSAYWKFDSFGSGNGPRLRFHRAGYERFNFYDNGNLFYSGSASSDRDLKEDIQPVTGTSIDKVIQLTPKTFKYIGNDTSHTGFIAQEVKEVWPSLVNGTDGNKDMGVDYYGIIAHLVNCVKELKAENDSLKARVTAIEGS